MIATALVVTPIGAASAQRSSQTVVIAATQEITSFDPAQNLSGVINAPVHTTVYEGLVTVDTSGVVTPVLATSWTLSDDAKSYTFKLRPNVKFHNGASFSSADVVYSLERARTGAPQVAQRFANVSSIVAVDPSTVRIDLKVADRAFIYTIADPTLVGVAIVPNNYTAAEIAAKPIGTGPFVFQSYKPYSKLILKPYTGYWKKSVLPNYKTLEVRLINQETSLVAAFLANQVSMVTLSNIPVVRILEKEKRRTALSSVPSGGFWLSFSRKGITRPDDVVRAFSLAIDRDQIVNTVFFGTAAPGSTANPVVKYGVPYKQLPNYTRNVTEAKRLLASAGYPNGINLEIIYPNRTPYTASLFEVLKSSVAEAGINLKIQPLEPAVWLPRFINANYDVSITDQAWYSNPVRYVIPRAGWQAPPQEIVPELPGLIDQLNAATDAQRPAIFQRIQRLEAEKTYPFMGLVWTNSYLGFNKTQITVGDTQSRITGSVRELYLSIEPVAR